MISLKHTNIHFSGRAQIRMAAKVPGTSRGLGQAEHGNHGSAFRDSGSYSSEKKLLYVL